QVRQPVLDREEGPLEVHPHEPVPVGLVVLVKQPDVDDARAVDEDVQPPEVPDGLRQRAPDLFLVPHVDAHRDRTSADRVPDAAGSGCLSTPATLAPPAATSRAVASPMPEAAPLIQAVCPSSLRPIACASRGAARQADPPPRQGSPSAVAQRSSTTIRSGT